MRALTNTTADVSNSLNGASDLGQGPVPVIFFFLPRPARQRTSATVTACRPQSKCFIQMHTFFYNKLFVFSFFLFFFFSGLPLPSSETLWSQPQHSSSSSFNFLPMIGAWPIPPCFEHSETWCNRGGSKSLPRAFLLGCGCRNQQQK